MDLLSNMKTTRVTIKQSILRDIFKKKSIGKINNQPLGGAENDSENDKKTIAIDETMPR
jgi:hypothetical protein